ncbi:ISSth1, transposase (orf2), IS3 family [Streptococcus uberis]|nr:ISSth1, transposase (orf2), IS3 family [Streptococcus uberis]
MRKFEKNGLQGLVDRRGKGLESRPDLTETEQLQLKIKQLASLRNRGCFTKKVRRHQTRKQTVRLGKHLAEFQVIKNYHDEEPHVPIQALCKLLKVSLSAYSKWLKHQETNSEKENTKLIDKIKELHRLYNGILDYRRMTTFINRQLGTTYNKKRIRRLMHILGISSVIRRVRHACTKAGDRFYEENILNRDFTATAPNKKWCTDVTYLQYGLGAKAYLSAIKDLYDGSIIAYEISHNNEIHLL